MLCRSRGTGRGTDEWKGVLTGWGWPDLKKALADLPGVGRDDGHVRVAIDEMHAPQLALLVLDRVLNDAEAVRPEVLHAKGMRDVDSVADCLGKAGGIDPGSIGGYVGRSSPMGLVFAPHVAERDIFPSTAVSGG